MGKMVCVEWDCMELYGGHGYESTKSERQIVEGCTFRGLGH